MCDVLSRWDIKWRVRDLTRGDRCPDLQVLRCALLSRRSKKKVAIWNRRRRVDVPACDKLTQMGFRAPLHQGASHARQLHLHQRQAASSSLFEQSSSAPKLETADDRRTCGGSTPWPVGPHLLVQATELLPPMSAAEQRSSGMSIPDPKDENAR